MVKDLKYRSGQVFKGGRAGNCRLQTTSPVPCALTASRVSVTKAGGLSDAPGTESHRTGRWRYRDTYIIEVVYLYFILNDNLELRHVVLKEC